MSWTEIQVFIDGMEYDGHGIHDNMPDRIAESIAEFKQEFKDDDEWTTIRTRRHHHEMAVACRKVPGGCTPTDVQTVWNNGGHMKGCKPGSLCEPCGQKILDASAEDFVRVCREVTASSEKFHAVEEATR